MPNSDQTTPDLLVRLSAHEFLIEILLANLMGSLARDQREGFITEVARKSLLAWTQTGSANEMLETGWRSAEIVADILHKAADRVSG